MEQVNVGLLGVSSSGEVAISVGCSDILMPMLDCGGTLGRMSLSGGAPRELSPDIRAADWSPDGKSLAVVRQVRRGSQVEYPMGSGAERRMDQFPTNFAGPETPLLMRTIRVSATMAVPSWCSIRKDTRKPSLVPGEVLRAWLGVPAGRNCGSSQTIPTAVGPTCCVP